MAKKDNNKALVYQNSMKQALEKFDLKALKKWMQKYNAPLWRSFKNASDIVQMATMCKMICNRTDLLNTEAHKKAVQWLKEHDMKGRLF